MATKNDKNKSKLTFLIIFLFLVVIGLLAFIYYPHAFEVREYKIVNKNIPDNFVGFKIVHFSDIHYGTSIKEKDLKNIVIQINKLEPDLIVFTGDLFDRTVTYSEEELTKFSEYLKLINADIGKFAVSGNHDYANNFFDTVMSEANFKVLKNTYSLVYNNGVVPLFIGGLPSSLKDTHNYEELFNYFEDNNNLENVPSYKIILMHEPDNITNLNNYGVDLVLSGHSHNGQVRLPFIGAIIVPKGSKTYYDEYYKVNNTDLYISGGIGTSTFPVRFLNKSSINLYRLYNN